jgi:uracil-DNA glycosylase family 4
LPVREAERRPRRGALDRGRANAPAQPVAGVAGKAARRGYTGQASDLTHPAAPVADAPSRAEGPAPGLPVRPTPDLAAVRRAIVACARCPRLRAWCERVAREKKAAHRHETYWGRPVPGFGDPGARLLVLGLAPAAHGANRTGRVFTGDGSGDFLMAALHATGFASIPTSQRADDGLVLRDAYIAAAVRCAPPGNRPSPVELAACAPHLEAEVAALGRLRVVVALGRIAADAYWRLLARRGLAVRPRPAFGHGAVFRPSAMGVPSLVMSYHPSRQNTNTGRLTASMLREVFETARALLSS